MSDFAEHLSTHLRLTLLRLLNETGTYRANSAVLTIAAEDMGLSCTRAQVRTELAWLAEQGLVSLEEPTPNLVIATATERGLDVATGRARVPGVARPTPAKR